MTRLLVLLTVLMLAAAPLSAADKDKKDDKKDKKENAADNRRPSGNEIQQEATKAKLEKNRAVEKKYKNGDVVRFVPAKIGGQHLGDYAKGAIVGLLDIDRKGDLTGLPAGKYHVYIKQIKGDWDAFYEKDGHIVKDAVGVHFVDKGHPEPKFKDGGDCVLYSHWEFCY